MVFPVFRVMEIIKKNNWDHSSKLVFKGRISKHCRYQLPEHYGTILKCDDTTLGPGGTNLEHGGRTLGYDGLTFDLTLLGSS